MDLYPAIDLKNGDCVRLLRGDMDKATVFNNDPGAQAAAFVAAGAPWLHVVDLNGAFAGDSRNGESVDSILAAAGSVPVQLGGGIRSLEQIEVWLDKGIRRVILGTAAVKNPDLVIEACRLYPGRVAVGLDARDGKVALSGWAEETDVTAIAQAERFEGVGVAAIIYTDIDRDGAMAGPNIPQTAALADAVSIPIIASGGVSSLKDLMALRDTGSIAGAITGRALYDKAFTLEEALAAC